MNASIKYILAGCALIATGVMTSCSDFEPTGYEKVAALPKASNVKAAVEGHKVNLTWNLPSAQGITDVLLVRNGNNAEPTRLGAGATSHTVLGQKMGQEYLYTIKVVYGDRISEGETASATLPVETFTGVSNLEKSVKGRRVTLSWNNPNGGFDAVRIIVNGDEANAVTLPADATTYTFYGQPMETELNYTVELLYDTYYPSTPATVSTTIPYIKPNTGFLLLADSWRDLEDDDERAAAEWFADQPDSEFIKISELADLDPDSYPVLWILVDRVGQAFGWENLPDGLADESTIAALKNYSAMGGSLYLSNMATQLTLPLGFVPEGWQPSIFGNGTGGSGGDVWVLQPHLGWDFRNGSDQGYYDRVEHEIYQGLTMEDPNGYGYSNLPLIGPGQREDHNCMWDCNIYGRGEYRDVIANFEAVTGSLVLASWGHVRDHCVAGIVAFNSTPVHGRCVANGLAAYEWNQNSGPNPYQGNIEKLTSNILNFLK